MKESKFIAIDGNEANIARPVGSNHYALQIIINLTKSYPEKKFKILLKSQPLPHMPHGDNIEYEVFGPQKLWTRFALPLRIKFKKPKISVLFTPGHYTPNIEGVKKIIVIFDLAYLKFPEHFAKKDLIQLKKWTNISLKACDGIITISNSTRNDIQKYYPDLNKPIKVIYPGYNTDIFKKITNIKSKESVIKKYALPKNFTVFVGTVQPRKNIQGVISAMKFNHDFNLVVVGKKGWLFDPIFENAKNFRNRITFTDYVPDEDLPVIISLADSLILPSFYEGFGIPVVEALACGCPVIVSKNSSLSEAAGNAGLFVDPHNPKDIAEKISILQNDKKIKNNLINNAQKQILKFSWQENAKQTYEFISSIVD